MGTFRLTLIFVICVRLSSSVRCPARDPCVCEYDDDGKYVVNCRNKHLLKIPQFYDGDRVDILDLSNNQIRAINTGDFENIKPKSIKLVANVIQTIDDDAFRTIKDYLTSLVIVTNRDLPKVALSELINLEKLHITVFELSTLLDMVFPRLTKLKSLTFYGRDTAAVSHRAFNNIVNSLVYLSLQLTTDKKFIYFPFAIQNLKNLQSLNLYRNRFDKIPDESFRGLSNLKTLFLQNNDLSDALSNNSFRYLENSLEYLNLQETQIDRIPAAIHRLKSLKTIRLQNNPIKEIRSGDLSGLDSLLDLKIGSIYFPRIQLKLYASSFSGVEKTLNTLSIVNAGLKKIPTYALNRLSVLKFLFLYKNKITTIPANAAKGLSVEYFDLSNNQIFKISSDAFGDTHHRTSLKLSHNKIRKVDFVADPCLFETIELANNPIECDCDLFNNASSGGLTISGTCESPQKFMGWKIESVRSTRNLSEYCPEYYREPMCTVTSGHSEVTGNQMLIGLFILLMLSV